RRRVRLELLRQHLAQNVDFLKAAHLGGASGQLSVQAYAAFMDGFLSTIFRLAVEDARKEGDVPGPIVLVALGGYGRGELGPLSDLDLMVIYDGEMGPFVQRVTQGLLYTLWDLGLTVGHSVRSLPDCVAMARTDFASRTSMQEARYVVGDRRLFQRFRRVLAENVYRKDFGQFLETALTERDQRYRKFGGSPYMGEPNVKESAGGLRDLHTAMWLPPSQFGSRRPRAHPAGSPREGADHPARGAADGRGPDLPLARAQRAPLPLALGPQERRALARRPAADRQALRLRERRGLARRREIHPRLLPPRPRHPPGVEPPDRALPGDALAQRHRAAAAPPGGAGRRALCDGRTHPPRPPRRSRLPRRARAAHEGLLALAPARVRAGRGRGAGGRGDPRPRGRRPRPPPGGAPAPPRRRPGLG